MVAATSHPSRESLFMQDLLPTRATYADILSAPPHLIAEIIGGRLVTHPRPAPKHVVGTSRLGLVIGHAYDWKISKRSDGWWILDEPEIHLGDAVVAPDLAGWRHERMPGVPATAWFDLAPDWICEVISPSTARYNKGEKRDLYAARGVEHLWHIDPAPRLLEVFELSDGKWVLLKTYRDEDSVTAPPFTDAPFSLGLLWAD